MSQHADSLTAKILGNGYLVPIIADIDSKVILDGHHRYNILKKMGFRKIPVVFVNYFSEDVQLHPRKKFMHISKKEVVEKGISQKLFPAKTSRHIFKTMTDFKVSLDEIKNVNEEVTKMKYDNILQLIGNTPLVRINKLNENSNVVIYAKLEGQNPGGSVKDRIALSMVENAEKRGELKTGMTILEPTSGNTGIGLAIVGIVKGYNVKLTMSSGMSQERKTMLKSLGVDLVETEAEKGTDGAIEKAREILNSSHGKYWMPYQFDNPANPSAHYHGTAVEILEQLPDITAFVAGMGTSGTLMGAGKRLKENGVKIIGAEPQQKHKIQGLKNMHEAIVPRIYDESLLDEKITVFNEDAYETARQLALKEGIFAGMSSGAAMWAALQYAKTIEKGKIVVIFPDRGEKYLSTILFTK